MNTMLTLHNLARILRTKKMILDSQSAVKGIHFTVIKVYLSVSLPISIAQIYELLYVLLSLANTSLAKAGKIKI